MARALARLCLSCAFFWLADDLLLPIEVTAETGAVVSAPRRFKRNPELVTPAGLRGRVDFWKDVFSKYERNQVVLHHRVFPQVVYEVLDMRQQAAEMDLFEFERWRKRRVEDRVKEITQILKRLGEGGAPQGDFEQHVADVMTYIKGVPNPAAWTAKEDLVRSQSGIREKWIDAVERAGRYLGTMERIFVDEYGLPIEITRLPFVESSFDYTAYSAVGAAGIWQFMPRTGRQYHMMVNSVVDERRDPIKATEGAANYLASAYNELRSWPLAITSYNHGLGGVLRKVRELGTTDFVRMVEDPIDRPFGFASSNFFPSFLAAVECYDDRKVLFPEVKQSRGLRLTEYRLPRAMSVAHVMRQLGIGREELMQANYALLEKVWQGRANIPAGYVLRVPEEYGVRLGSLRAPEAHVVESAPSASAVYGGVVYKVRKGDTLSSIAKHFGVPSDQIRELNSLGDKGLKVGQVLKIKERQAPGQKSKVEDSSASSPTKREKPKANTDLSALSYRVKSGDTIWELAKRFGTTRDEIRRANGMKSDSLRMGATIKIPRR